MSERTPEPAAANIPFADEAHLREARELSVRSPEPAEVRNVAFGTAGWTDKTLVSSRAFYPRVSMNARDRLSYYSGHFSMVEVDATYYALLPPSTAEKWVIATRPGFTFHVKAHPVLTGHPIEVSRLPGDLKQALCEAGIEGRTYPSSLPPTVLREMEDRFEALVMVLSRAEKLGAVMLQFPPWFRATRGNVRSLEALRARFPSLPLSVEFRHRSWLDRERRSRVLDLLRAQEMIYVAVDEPDVSVARGGVPPVTAVTHEALAMVRLHGQNKEGWRSGASVWERFNYLYSERELREWVPKVRELSERAEKVHVVFNNCVRDYATLGAKGLCALLNRQH